MIYYLIFYFFREVSSSPEPLFVLQHKFWSRRLACLWLLSGYSKFMLSTQCHIHISIYSHWYGHLFSFLLQYLTVFYTVSAKKFGIFERTLKFNLYIHVQNSNDTFINPLPSDNYTERLLLIFRNGRRKYVVQYTKPLSVHFIGTREFYRPRRRSVSEWHDIKQWGPNSLPHKLCIRKCRRT